MTNDRAVPRLQDIHVARLGPDVPLVRSRSTDDRVVYAIGDIHGRYDLLAALLSAIVADAALLPDGTPLLVFCGDYVDRGPDSCNVLASLVWMTRHAPVEIALLRGNHEAMLIGFLDEPERYLPWLRRDGVATLRSYGVPFVVGDTGTTDFDCRDVRDRLLDRMPVSHLDLLRGLPITATCGDYVFVHAGLRPGVSLARQADEDCLWIRGDFLEDDHAFEKIVVHGHTWSSDKPEITDNRIGIDTGAYSTGVLTAVRLEGAAVEFLQARSDAERSARTKTARVDDLKER